MTVAALDFGGTTVKAGLVRADGSVTDAWTLPAPVDRAGLDPIADRVRQWGATERLLGVGVAVPGVVDASGSALVGVHGKSGAIAGVDLRGWVARHAGLSPHDCPVENDARAALAGELVPGGAAAGASSAALLIVGTGLGCAVAIDGRVLRGSHGYGGILGGHVTVRLDGPRCACGNVGCAEALAGSRALPERARSHPGYGASPLASLPAFGYRELVEAEAGGDPCARWLLDDCVRVWAATLVTLVHVVDPDVLVLGGAPLAAAQLIVPRLEQLVDDHLWRGMPRPPLRVARDPAFGVVRGLAAIVRSDADRRQRSQE